jgi:hypothetical protein
MGLLFLIRTIQKCHNVRVISILIEINTNLYAGFPLSDSSMKVKLTAHSSYKNLYKIIFEYISHEFSVIYHFLYSQRNEILIYSSKKTFSWPSKAVEFIIPKYGGSRTKLDEYVYLLLFSFKFEVAAVTEPNIVMVGKIGCHSCVLNLRIDEVIFVM